MSSAGRLALSSAPTVGWSAATSLRVAWIVFAVATGIYVAFALVIVGSLHAVDYDEAIFMDVARSIRETGLPTRSIAPDGWLYLEHTPLYPYLLATVSWAGEFPARLLSLALGLATVGLVARLAGPVAGVLLALNPLFIRLSVSIWMEILLAFLVVASIVLLARQRVVLAGLVAGLAVLSKELAVAYVVAGALFLVYERRRPVDAFRFAAPSAGALAAWASWGALFGPEELRVSLSRWTGAFLATGPQQARGPDLAGWIESIGRDAFGPVLLLALIGAAFLFLRSRPRVVPIAVLYVVATIGASLVMRVREPRHLVAVVAVAAIIVGLAVPRRAIAVATLAVALLAAPGLMAPTITGRLSEDATLVELRDTARQMPGPVVSHPVYPTVVGWYSGHLYDVRTTAPSR